MARFLMTLILVSSLLIQSGVVWVLTLIVNFWATDMISDRLFDLSAESDFHAFDSMDSSDLDSLNSTAMRLDGSDVGRRSLPSHLTYVDLDRPSLLAALPCVMNSLLRNILSSPANESCPTLALTNAPYFDSLPDPGMFLTDLPSKSDEGSPLILDSSVVAMA
jgi:hypothetical protein